MGNDRDTVQCHTKLTTCCVQEVGRERGDWHAPDGTVLPTTSAPVTQQLTYHRINLLNHNSGAMSGIYHCSIAVSTESNESVYVGLYSSGGEGRASEVVLYSKQMYFTYCCFCTGDVTIPVGMIFSEDSDIDGENPRFTLTCISTGGPATTVTWTRDSEAVSGGMTMLDDRMTAQYTHTLIVRGRLGGRYQCSVVNNKPSSDTAQLTVEGTLHNHSTQFPHIMCLCVVVHICLCMNGCIEGNFLNR